MIKKTLLIAGLSLFTTMGANAIGVSKIEPLNWFVGMKNPELQLMVYGEDVASYDQFSIDYPGVTLKEVVKPGSKNYVILYLNISSDAKAGKMPITFQKGKKKKVWQYELKNRAMAGADRKGFDASDVLYLLMPDRFANGDPSNDVVKTMVDKVCDRNEPSLRHGGDLEGIRQHLDYFTDLGVTALWFTPVLENDMVAENGKYSSYHGYATTDYYNVDARFGSNELYKKLIDEAHAKGLKIVMDMIFNHCGSNHVWLKDMPSPDWFNHPDYQNNYLQTSYTLTPVVDPYASDVDKREAVEGWFVKSMPDLNQNNPHVLRYLIQNSFWWIETVGIDGIRMDTYPYAYADAMAKWLKELNDEYPNYNVVGETWVVEPPYTATWQKDSKLATKNSNLKTVMDFSFYDKLDRAMAEETVGQAGGLNKIYNNFVYDYLYPNPSCIMAFIENHDTDRFLKNGQNVDLLKQAYTLLLTTHRIPQLYYGSEVLMNGTKEKSDGYVRKDFPGGWQGDKANCFDASGRTKEQNDMYDYLKKLLHWRAGNEVISKGDMKHFIPFKGVYVYSRSYNGKKVVVMLNGTSSEVTIPASRYKEVLGGKESANDVITGKSVSLAGDITLKARQNLILEFK